MKQESNTIVCKEEMLTFYRFAFFPLETGGIPWESSLWTSYKFQIHDYLKVGIRYDARYRDNDKTYLSGMFVRIVDDKTDRAFRVKIVDIANKKTLSYKRLYYKNVVSLYSSYDYIHRKIIFLLIL